MSESGRPGMVDYQYQMDLNDPVAKLRLAMDNMDGMSLDLFSFYLSSTQHVCAQWKRYSNIASLKKKKTTRFPLTPSLTLDSSQTLRNRNQSLAHKATSASSLHLYSVGRVSHRTTSALSPVTFCTHENERKCTTIVSKRTLRQ